MPAHDRLLADFAGTFRAPLPSNRERELVAAVRAVIGLHRGLGLERSKGRKHVQPPAPGEVARLIAAADELTPPSFAAYLFTACYSAMRPGELDALRWDDLDFTPGAETIAIARQWNVKAAKITTPKHGSGGKIAMVEPLRDRLLDLPRESEWG